MSNTFNLDLSIVSMPDGYTLKPNGTFKLRESKEGQHEQMLTNSPVWVKALARDENHSSWSLLLAYKCREGQEQHAIVQASRLQDLHPAFFDALASHGVLIDPRMQLEFKTYLFSAFSQPSLPKHRLVQQLGFYKRPNTDRVAFVLPEQIIEYNDEAEAQEVLSYTPRERVNAIEAYHSSGTLEDWRKAVEPFGEHAIIVAAIAYGLAAPFATLVGIENGGIHLRGASSTGKSTALQVAASVAGCAADPARSSRGEATLFQRWNATAAAVEGMTQPHSGLMAFIDEIGSNDAGLNLYNLFGGTTKARLEKDGSMQDRKAFRIQVLSSGEYSMSEHIETVANKRATTGTEVRMLDVPVQTVDAISRALGASPSSDHALLGEQMTALKENCGRYYGTALPALVKQVLSECPSLDELTRRLKELVQQHTQLLCDEVKGRGQRLNPAQRRAVMRLGLIAAIGELAATDVLPFTEVQVDRAIRAVRDAWLATMPCQSEDEVILGRIQDYAIRYCNNAWGTVPENRAPSTGWPYFRTADKCAFTREQLCRASGCLDATKVAEILARAGWLFRNDPQRVKSDVPKELMAVSGERRMYVIWTEQLLGSASRDLMEPQAPSEPDDEAVG